jgi:hypothetical protein
VAFVWLLNVNPIVRFSFAALTIGALAPDVELVVAYILGASVFCGWDFPCTTAPDRLVLHSLLGATTVNVALTIVFVKLISLLKPERFGINGFKDVKINAQFCGSAAIGGVSHVLVDWLHHAGNPVFFPIMVGNPPTYYLDGLLLPYMSVTAASFLVAIIASAIVLFLAVRAVIITKYSLSELIFNPKLTLSLVTESLARDR